MGAEKDAEKYTEQKVEKDMEEDPGGEANLDLGGLDDLDGTGTESPRGAKHGVETRKGPRKKRKGSEEVG